MKDWNHNRNGIDYESPELDRREILDWDALQNNPLITGEGEATGGFPTSEADAEIQAAIQADIDADVRPPSAKDFSELQQQRRRR